MAPPDGRPIAVALETAGDEASVLAALPSLSQQCARRKLPRSFLAAHGTHAILSQTHFLFARKQEQGDGTRRRRWWRRRLCVLRILAIEPFVHVDDVVA